MATSPNYSWPEPDNTDLVKNGALAMRTLGNAIDTTMATMTPKSTVTAKGSLIAATAASTPANLAVGNNGETLVADSSTSTGLRYQPARTQQLFLNSAFDIWQRGTSGAGNTTGAASAGFVADRWQGIRGAVAAGMTMSRQTAQNTALPNVQYAMRIQRDSGNTSTQDMRVFYSAETADSIPFAGQTITFSYYVRKGANYSGGDVTGTIYSGTGTDQNLGITGYTGSSAVVAVTRTSATLTTDWTRVQGTATVAATATELGLLLSYTPTGTAGANDWIEITGVQLEVGSIATPFKRQNGTIQQELAACQRYYFRTSTGTGGSVLGNGYTATTTVAYTSVQYPVVMRITPTAADFVDLRIEDQTGTALGISAITFSNPSAFMARLGVTISGATAGRFCQLQTGSTSGYVGFSAEL